MRKLGRLLEAAVAPKPFYRQECFAHALHLAVEDTFELEKSKKKAESRAAGRLDETEGLSESGQDTDVASWNFAAIFDGGEG